MCREKWIQISRQHGLEIEDTPKPKDQTGLTLEEFHLVHIHRCRELSPPLEVCYFT